MRPPIVLDTQLLVLLTVGATSVGIIKKHKNLTEFTTEDFDLLLILLGRDPELILIPNVVSEASNLLRHHREPEKGAIMGTFAKLVMRNKERYVESKVAVQRSEYRRLGVTDAAILEVYEPEYEILTADAALCITAANKGMRATNFNHKREEFGIL